MCIMIALVGADIRSVEDLQDELALRGYGSVVIAGLAASNDSLLSACRLVVVDEESVPAFLEHQARVGASANEVLVLVAVADQEHMSAVTGRVIGYISGIVAVVERGALSRALLAVLEGLRTPGGAAGAIVGADAVPQSL